MSDYPDDRDSAEISNRCWFALYTKSRHEKKVQAQLNEKSIESYLPTQKRLRIWSDRKKWIDEPVFRSYVFIHADAMERYRAVQAYGAVRVVGFNGKPAIVTDDEIRIIRRIIDGSEAVESCSPYRLGDAVRIIHGPLRGLEGRLVEMRGEHRCVVNIPSIRQALRFNVDLRYIELMNRRA